MTGDGGVPGQVVGDVLLMVAPDRGAAVRAKMSVALVQRALGPLFNERFDQPPYQAVTVLIFSTTGAYEKGCRTRLGKACEERFGSYRPLTRTIFVDAERGISSALHELTHAIMQNDFALARAWMVEGLAAVYERPVFYGDGGITGSTSWRLDRLKQALALRDRERSTAGIDALLAMSDEDFLGRDVDLHYAIAVMVCQWLDQQGLLWPFYRAWRGTVRQDPTGSAAFEAVVGQSPAHATEAWRTWVGRQRFVAGGGH